MNQDNEHFIKEEQAPDAQSETSESVTTENVSDAEQAVSQPPEVKTANVPFSQKIVPALKKFGKAVWAYIKHAKIELIVIAAIIVLDLVTKALAAKYLSSSDKELIPDFLYFTFMLNDAAAFGGLFGLEKVLSPLAIRIILLIITTIAVGVLCYLMYRFKDRHKLMRLSLALILAGAVGNYVDRLFLGEVRDFIHIVYFGMTFSCIGKEISDFAIFNIADVALTVGVILFFIYFIAIYKEPKAKPAVAEEAAVQAGEEPLGEQPTETTEESAAEESDTAQGCDE